VALVAARARYLQANPSVRVEDLMIYCTTQTHSGACKAGIVLGISVHAVPVFAETNFGVTGRALKEAIEEDVKNGKKPIAFCMSLFASITAIEYESYSQLVQLARLRVGRSII
jgi:glutamate/tyrosine decarboxylase-like PLP-dependent enzyme